MLGFGEVLWQRRMLGMGLWEMVPESWCSCRKSRGMSPSLRPFTKHFLVLCRDLASACHPTPASRCLALAVTQESLSILLTQCEETGVWKGLWSLCKSSSSYPLLQPSQPSEVAKGSNMGTSAMWLILVPSVPSVQGTVSSLSCLCSLL